MKITTSAFGARPCSMLWASRQWLAFYRQALVEFFPAGLIVLALVTIATGIHAEPRWMIAAVLATVMAPAISATYRYVFWRRWSRR